MCSRTEPCSVCDTLFFWWIFGSLPMMAAAFGFNTSLPLKSFVAGGTHGGH